MMASPYPLTVVDLAGVMVSIVMDCLLQAGIHETSGTGVVSRHARKHVS